MRVFIIFLSISFYLVSPAFAASSQFLEDISGVIQIQPGAQEVIDGRLILKNCSVRTSDLGEGSIGQMTIANEGPDKLGELILDNVKFKTFEAQSVHISNLTGNFTVLAATLPFLTQIQFLAIENPKKVYKLLDSLKPFLPALKKFHLGKLEMSGLVASDKAAGIMLDKISYSDISLASIGDSKIDNFQLNIGPAVACTINNLGFKQIKIPDIETFLSINQDNFISGRLTPSEIKALSNFTIKNFYVKNAQVPLFNVGLDEGEVDVEMKEEKLKGFLNISGLRIPGNLLAFTSLQNLPMRVTLDGAIKFKSIIDDQGIASNQKFTIAANGLFDLKGGFAIVLDKNEKLEDLTNVDINFVNKGIANMVPEDKKSLIIDSLQVSIPSLAEAITKVFSGAAKVITVKAEDAKNPKAFQVTVE